MRCLLIVFSVYCTSLHINAITNVNHGLACENSKLTLKCAEDKVINILDGNYGRSTKLTCTHGPIKHDSCVQEHTVDILTDLCEGQKKCVVEAVNNVFGDNCVGTHKYLYVLYRCVFQEEFKHSLACENQPIHLECKAGKVIQIEKANYGRRSQVICADGPIHHLNCVSDTSTNILKGLCDDKKSCTVPATNYFFADTCYGTHKYLSAKYKCIPGEAQDEDENTDLQCEDGAFILPSLICDGKQDCLHGDDELVCSYETKHVCEHQNLKIECSKDEIIKITNANYGRMSPKICPQKNIKFDLDCKAKNSKHILQQNCDGKQKCEIQASNNIFGDPCESIEKYLEVQFNCEPGTGAHKVIPRSIYN